MFVRDRLRVSLVDEWRGVYLSHTEVGYTYDQLTLWDLQRRFLERVIDLVEEALTVGDADVQDGG